MAEWYYRILGEEIGPLSSKALLEKVRTGVIAVDTEVRKGSSNWSPAGDVEGLFKAANHESETGKRSASTPRQ